MISMIRIDDRLIHGQVVFVWTEYLGVDHIVVANDKVVKNDVQKMLLKMVVPDTIKCNILGVSDAIEILNNPKAENLKILVVVNNPADARRIIEKVKNIPLVNIASYGLIINDLFLKKKVCDTIYVTDEDVKEFNATINTGIKVEYQAVPTNPVQDLSEMLNKIQ